jgi:hypothetical protein
MALNRVFGGGALLACMLAMPGCCGTDKMVTVDSPGGTRSLTSYRLNCGATTDWATVVQVTAPAFLGAHHTQDVLHLRGDIEIQMSWVDDEHAVVGHGPAHVNMSREEAGGVRFTFTTTR